MHWRRLGVQVSKLLEKVTEGVVTKGCSFVYTGRFVTKESNTVCCAHYSQFPSGSTMSGEPDAKKDLQTIKEGKAKIYQPSSVFYNPVQEFNRDLTIAIISEFAKDRIREKGERIRRKLERNKLETNEDKDKSCSGKNNNANWERTKSEKNGDEDAPDNYKNENADFMEIDRTGDSGKGEDHEIVAGKKHENGLRILEGLAASGLRSVRFGLEIPGVKEIIANDLDEDAVKIIEKNIFANGIEDLVSLSQNDASLLMYQNKQFTSRFDVIDLDPYGTAAPFLDSAVQAIQNGGLLCVTCTDAAILCGNFGETCFAKYGSMSLRTPYCHEMAVRIILRSIESHANRYGNYIVPLLCLSVDFYFRLFVKVYNGPNKCKESILKTAMVYHCSGCSSFELQKLGVRHEGKGGNHKYTPATGPQISEKCEHCGSKHHIGGPVSIAPLHDKTFVERIISSVRESPERFKTSRRIEGMLSMIMEELDVPFYHVTDDLYNAVHCTPMKDVDMRSAILNAGYKVSLSPFAKNSIRTDAPNGLLWDIIRTYVKKNPINPKRLTNGSPAKRILDQEPTTEISFDLHPDANPKSRAGGLLRFQTNPERGWGPKARPRKSDQLESLDERREKYQGKRKRNEMEEEVREETVKQSDS